MMTSSVRWSEKFGAVGNKSFTDVLCIVFKKIFFFFFFFFSNVCLLPFAPVFAFSCV